jgi:hypothetical protein
MTKTDPDALVTLVRAQTDFEANIIVSILTDAGIKAVAFGGAYGALPMNVRFMRVPVQVRAADVEAAQAALQANVSDSIDLDWDEVDVGEREDELPLSTPGRMPVAAKIAFALALLLIFGTMLALMLSGWF